MTDPSSASIGIVASLRKRIMDGQYPSGARLAEIPVAQALGVSRTPVRLAFRTLAQEGLLERAGKRGYVVRAFSDADVLCAVEVRGVLEGLAARRVAEAGMSDVVRGKLQACVDAGERVLAAGRLSEQAIADWSQWNQSFHHTLVDAAGSRVLGAAITGNNHLPFASADAIVIDRDALEREYLKLRTAQLHHQLVLDALKRRESARAEMLMREHAFVGFRYGDLLGSIAG